MCNIRSQEGLIAVIPINSIKYGSVVVFTIIKGKKPKPVWISDTDSKPYYPKDKSYGLGKVEIIKKKDN